MRVPPIVDTAVERQPTGLGAHERRLLWPDPEQGPWLLVFQFIELDGRSECVGFEMRSFVKDTENEEQTVARGTPVPLTATLLRQVSFDSESQRARKEGVPYVPHHLRALMQELGVDLSEGTTAWERAGERATGQAPTGRPAGRPRRYGREHFAEVAAVYRDADRQGLPPTREVQDYFARKWDDEVTRSQAAKWVYRARHEFDTLGEDE